MLKIIQIATGVFDLAVDTELSEDAAVATLIYAALCTDAQAPESRVPDLFDRRGWFRNPEAGSGLWHVRQQPLGGADSPARRETYDMVRTALKKHVPVLKDIEITEAAAAGNVSRVSLDITGTHNGRKFIVRVPL